jgi:hypothetical protein
MKKISAELILFSIYYLVFNVSISPIKSNRKISLILFIIFDSLNLFEPNSIYIGFHKE